MTITSSLSRTSLLPLSTHTEAPVTQARSEARRADVPSQAGDGSSRANGDSLLAQNYGKALSGFTGVPANDNAIMVDVPAHSTFGQWWKQLGDAMQSPDFIAWRRDNNAIDSIKILPSAGQINFQIKVLGTGIATLDVAGDESSKWRAVRGPLMDAGGIISNKGVPFSPPNPMEINRAPARLVGQFYFEQMLLSPSAFQQRAAELERDRTFSALEPPTFSSVHEQRSEDALNRQKTLLGNTHDRHEAAKGLGALSEDMKSGTQDASTLSQYLSETPFKAHPDSSYTQDWARADAGLNTLKDFLEYHGINIPGTAEEVENLKMYLLTPAPQGPVNGNYGGAMSWPQPLDADNQRQLLAFLLHGNVGELNIGVTGGVLEALMRGVAIEPSELRNPRQLLDRLIQSPKGQALGAAIQAKFEALSVKGSINDWLLAALNLNPGDTLTQRALPQKHISGFDLAGEQLKGKPLSETLQRVADHLYFSVREASSPERALVQAHLRLASKAPELLMKDIPPTLTHGSPAHVSFSTAVARLEAQAPGVTATMSYADVMMQGDIAPVSDAQRKIEYVAQHEALKEWGLTNSIVTSVTSPADMNTISDAYNQQVTELRSASEARRTLAPSSRKDIALAELRKVLGDDIRLELKCIVLGTYDKDRPGPYSILDLYMENLLHSPPRVPYQPARRGNESRGYNQWMLEPYTPPRRGPGRSEANAPNFTLDDVLSKTSSLKNINTEFSNQFKTFGHALDSSVATQVKQLIAQLPLDDRKNIEYGSISAFREMKSVPTLMGGTPVPTPVKEGKPVLLKVMRDGESHTYELNVQKNTLEKRRDLGDFPSGIQPGPDIDDGKPLNVNTPYRSMEPIALSIRDDLRQETTDSGGPLNSFSSERTSLIGATVAKHTSAWQTLETEARGLTTFESEVPFYKKLGEMLLNLIPFASAIKNFSNGNIGEGIIDLSLDIFGLLTVGAGTVGKVAKVASSTASVGGKALRITKTVGLGAVSLLNPLDGSVDLVRAGGRGVVSAGKRAVSDAVHDIRQLRGMKNYDLVAASKKFDAAAMGTYTSGGSVSKGTAVLQDNKWYAFDTESLRPYGKALDDFQPSVKGGARELGEWENRVTTPSAASIQTRREWARLLDTHQGNGTPTVAFKRGYDQGNPELIEGYTRGMKSEDVMKLAIRPGRTAEEVGTLVRQQERLAVQHGFKGAPIFDAHVNSVGGTFTPVPQTLYLSQTNPLSQGQCAGMSRAFASAKAEGKERIFLDNLYAAAANPTEEASRTLKRSLAQLQQAVGHPDKIHIGKAPRQVSYQDMVKDLASADGNKTFMIETPDHAMLAGVRSDGANKTFFFYDPNYGVAEFSSEKMMRRGLDKIFNDKKLPAPYKTQSADQNKLEFKISEFDASWKGAATFDTRNVKGLYDKHIIGLKPASTPDGLPTRDAAITKPQGDTPPAATFHEVHMSDYTNVTATDPSSIIRTRGISDCTAIAVLTDLKEGIYGKRTLMHFQGGVPSTEQYRVLKELDAALAGGGKVIFVGGDLSRSTTGLASALGQSHNGETVLLNIMKRQPASTTIATASGIDIKPDGTFDLIEGGHLPQVLDSRAKAEVFDRAD
ncbi:YopT-type cysteine protease domain-containing protein [Pseudomonas reactans]|uniref:YopT-type cysteine protease domain-containing protein n=1 Tax=Pseudomonas reactans TaxID=117680 RepID=UPI0015A2F21E|nr:YopT-type cysteine protease domain-containing protein [Pseudomonas reactans]NWA67835.1 hypothetical protein [Pseudomonas reactans]